MHKALFGAITVVALVAVGVFLVNRTNDVAAGANPKDKTPVAAVDTDAAGSCCSKCSEAVAKKSCCSGEQLVSTGSCSNGSCNEAAVATSTEKTGSGCASEEGSSCPMAAMLTAAKGSCCQGEKEGSEEVAVATSEETGSCCAEKTGSCCAEKTEAVATSAGGEEKPCGCDKDCTCCEEKTEVKETKSDDQ